MSHVSIGSALCSSPADAKLLIVGSGKALPEPPQRAMVQDKSNIGSRFYRPELDVLRFVAFSCIFLSHYSLGHNPLIHQIQPALTIGLPLFFVLSSFLITELLQREMIRSGTVHIKMFYVRRILRIWPLYLTFVLAIYLFWHNSVPPNEPISRGRLLSYLLMSANWYAVVHHGFGISPISPLWSISVEEQFYLVWPLMYKLGGKAAATVVSLLTIPIAMLTVFVLTRNQNANSFLGPNSLVLFIFFGAGALVALYKEKIPFPSSPVMRLLIFVGSLALAVLSTLLFAAASPLSPWQEMVRWTITLTAALGLLFSVYGSEQLGKYKPLVYLGKISYGLYVFHILAIDSASKCVSLYLRHFNHGGSLLMFALSTTFAVAMATASYRFLETPFLRLKDRFAVVKTRAV